ncbi:MAG: aminopeptidase P family protein [Candidatus Abyssobacteria bacterium SURF_5]|uniref:Aminopeptidase P family protein n=1 Tax=Abyssobacteria bacterium (strain SURF_5) TaxID=2093360 RepID=A0A3A4NIQ2_ABYX5|nr:MAG: aminopeptidase P family protein [Candidatus Abyssubacteria bacterium SURF_5]
MKQITPITNRPSRQEYETRVQRVWRKAVERGFDAYVAMWLENVYYLSGFVYTAQERPFFLVLKDGQASFVLPRLEVDHAKEHTWITRIDSYREYPAVAGKGWADALERGLGSAKKIGIESTLPSYVREAIGRQTAIADIIQECRLVKSEWELGRIAYAAEVADTGTQTLLENSAIGVTELTLYSAGRNAMTYKIIQDMPQVNFQVTNIVAAVWIGRMSAMPHSTPSINDTIQEGQPNVSLVSLQADGYSAECERTYFVGAPDQMARELFETMMEARAIAFSLIKPGAVCGEIDRKVLDYLRAQGHADHILHRTGHGFGIGSHEAPWIAEGSEAELQVNEVVSIEPGIYIPGYGGFRHSDTVWVSPSGPVCLTESPVELDELVL